MAKKKPKRAVSDIVPVMLRVREGLRQNLAKDAERGAKSLNAEVVDRLEASYEQAERMALFKEQLEKHAKDEIRKLERIVENQRQEIEMAKKAFQEILGREVDLQGKVTALEAMGNLYDALIGNDPATVIATRGIAIHFANIPNWHETPELVSEMARDVADIVRYAAEGKPGQPVFSAEKD